jgi:two-component system, response regulator YesN
MKNRPVLLIKLLISYLLILACPMMVILFYFYPMLQNDRMNQITTEYFNITSEIRTNTDAILKNVNAIAYEIDTGGIFRSYKMGDQYDMLIALQRFKEIIRINPSIYDAMFYMRDKDILFTYRNSIIDIENIGKRVYYFESRNASQIREDLKSISKFSVEPACILNQTSLKDSSSTKVVPFVIPVGINSSKPYGTIVILVKEDQIFKGYNNVISGNEGDLIVADDKGKIILTKNGLDISKLNEYKSKIKGNETFTGNITIGGKEYITSSVFSSSYGWRYSAIIQQNAAIHNLTVLKNNTLIIFSLLMFIEIVVIYFAYRYNYIPIKKLIKYIKESMFPHCSPDMQKSRKVGELDIIHNTFVNLAEVSTNLKSNFQYSIPYIKECLLYRLISGSFSDIDEFNQIGTKYGAIIEYENYFVAVMSNVSGKAGIKNREELELLTEKAKGVFNDIQIFFMMDISHESIVAIFSCKLLARQDMVQEVRKLRNYLKNEYGVELFIGVGEPVHNIKDIQISYNQAIYANQYILMKDIYEILMYDDIWKKTVSSSYYDIDRIYQLKYAIKQKESGQIRELIDKITKSMMDASTPIHIIRLTFIDVIQMIYDELKQYGKDFVKIDFEAINPFLDSRAYSAHEYVEYIKNFADDLIRLIDRDSGSRKSTVEDIIIYINMNFTKYEFSIQEIADYFSMSVSNFSNFFKRHTGENFSDYVNNLRIQKAKEMLANNININVIANELGYSSASSFGRNFKRIVGISPGEFRKDVT